MADPATIAIALTAASAVSGAVGSMQAADAQKQQAQYQAAVARNNQQVAEQNAAYAEQVGRNQELAKREQTMQALGKQRALFGAMGIDPNSGSAARISTDLVGLGELDALTIRNNAARSAYGYRVQGSDFGANADLATMRGENAEVAGNIGAFSSIVGGASSVSDKWMRWKSSPSGPTFGAPNSAGDIGSGGWA